MYCKLWTQGKYFEKLRWKDMNGKDENYFGTLLLMFNGLRF